MSWLRDVTEQWMPPNLTQEDLDNYEQAARAKAQAQANLEAVQARWPHLVELVDRLEESLDAWRNQK